MKIKLNFKRNPYYTQEEITEAAKKIYKSNNWPEVEEECELLMKAAGIEWEAIYSEYGEEIDTLYEDVMYMTADFLNVEI